MSADNGVYILKTKEGHYRIAHIQGVGTLLESDLTPKNIIELWKHCRFTKNQKIAYEIAYKMANSLPFCEYGVQLVTYDSTWQQIKEEADKEVKPKGVLSRMVEKFFVEEEPDEE